MSKISELSDGGSLVSSDYLIAVRSGGNVKVRMDQINVDQIDLGDNEFIRLGNSQDLTIVHAATQSIINQAGIGDLLIQKAGSTKLTVNSSGIDVTGTVTADGLTSAGNVLVSQSGANSSITINRTDEAPQYNLTMGQSGSSPFITGNDAQIFNINVDPDNTENSSAFHLNIDGNIALKADAGGDISFYEDTGTTPKFFWDASAETLGIGTSSPDRLLTLQGDNSYMWMKDAGGGNVAFIGGDGSNDGFLRLYNGSHTAKVEIQSDGDTYFNGGSVGIGTTSPTVGKLQVNDGSGAIVAITRTSGATSGNLGVIRFGNTDVDSNLANITAIQDGSTTSSALTFETQSTGGSTAERMRIDSDGQILSTANEPTVTLKCSDTSLGADQYIGGFKFEKTDGSGAGAGVVGGMRMRSEGGVGESTYLQFSTSSSSANDAERMRILSSGGITFNGDTASANALDDYEEGTWTPAFGATTSDPTVGYNSQVGTYTKVGRLVSVIGYIITTSRSGGSGTLTIDGLPFTASSTVPLGSITIGFNYNWNTPPLNGGVQGSTNHIILYQDGRTNATSTPADIVASGNSYFYFSCTYYV